MQQFPNSISLTLQSTHTRLKTYRELLCGNCCNFLSYFFDTKIVKALFLLKNLLKSWFHEFFRVWVNHSFFHTMSIEIRLYLKNFTWNHNQRFSSPDKRKLTTTRYQFHEISNFFDHFVTKHTCNMWISLVDECKLPNKIPNYHS